MAADGAPVRQALVRASWAGDVQDRNDERIIIEQIQADNDGYFTFESPGRPILLLADSPDLKRSGRIVPRSMIANTIVVR